MQRATNMTAECCVSCSPGLARMRLGSARDCRGTRGVTWGETAGVGSWQAEEAEVVDEVRHAGLAVFTSSINQYDSMLGGTQPLKSHLVHYCEHRKPD